jgi:plasmid stabilization system protein ParE
MNLKVLREAEDELNEAIAYYEEKEPGLGRRLKEEARDAINWIGKNFSAPSLRPAGYRRVNLRVFSYYIAYFVWADTIWIAALAHSHRRPEYWIGRKRKVN